MQKLNHDQHPTKNWPSTYGQDPCPDTLRAVHELQNKQTRYVGLSVHARTPERYVRTILDAHVVRRRTLDLQGKGTPSNVQEFLRILASAGATSSDWRQSALFWCYGVRDELRSSSLPRIAMEHFDQLAAPDSVPGRSPTPPLTYTALAAWACRCLPPNSHLYALCCEIHDEVERGGRETERYSFPAQETRAWINWASTVCRCDCPLPDEELATHRRHRDRWKNMASGSEFHGQAARLIQTTWPSVHEEFYARQARLLCRADGTGVE